MKKTLLLLLLLPQILLAADNFQVTQGTGTNMAADDVGGVLHQRIKITEGADGAAADVSIANPLPVSAGRTDSFADSLSADITDTTSTAIKAAGGASVRHYVDTFTVSNSDTTQGTAVQLLDGSTVLYTCPAAAAYGGCAVTFPTPLRGSANTALNCKPLTTGAEIRCSVSGYSTSE